jgi:methylated-DNA-[protein]-cysteine S-methyltransferase
MAVVRDSVSVGEPGSVKLQAWIMPTPVGPFGLAARSGSVIAAGFTDDIHELYGVPDDEGSEMVSEIPGVTDRLERYFAGDLSAIDAIPTAPIGSERKVMAWAALRKAPPGPMSYKQLSELMVPPASARSAARACATNPIAVIVPCHRFIGSDGKLHGFGWGLPRKEWLLAHEERFMR